MAEYRVYYMNPDAFPRFIHGVESPTLSELKETHIELRTLQADNIEDVFRDMQAEFWSPNGEATDMLIAKGLRHTSMSVGDIAEDLEAGKFYVCQSVGWAEVE